MQLGARRSLLPCRRSAVNPPAVHDAVGHRALQQVKRQHSGAARACRGRPLLAVRSAATWQLRTHRQLLQARQQGQLPPDGVVLPALPRVAGCALAAAAAAPAVGGAGPRAPGAVLSLPRLLLRLAPSLHAEAQAGQLLQRRSRACRLLVHARPVQLQAVQPGELTHNRGGQAAPGCRVEASSGPGIKSPFPPAALATAHTAANLGSKQVSKRTYLR